MIRNFFKTAIRNLIRKKGYATINIAGLAVGIAACLLLFLIVRYELSYDMIMVTHSEHDARYSHRIVRMLDGQVVLENIMV